VAVRVLGQHRGTAITGVFGGLVSSTAVTLSFSRRSREEGTHHPTRGVGSHVFDALAAGILLAWVVMFVRVLVEVAVVHRALLGEVLQPMAGMAVVGLGAGMLYLRRGAEASRRAAAEEDVPLTNPFSLLAAIKFALFFALVLVVVEATRRLLPGQGMYLVAGLAGLTDVDAITLSMASYARDGGDPEVAANAIGIAALTNTVVKAGMVVMLAAPGLRRRVVVAAGLVLAGGVTAVLLG
jgi:uncharacterized membrane protein (DUF4010 family)